MIKKKLCGYGITFYIAGSWSFRDGTAGNFIIFGVDNNSSSYAENLKNYFLILGLGQTYGINGRFGSPEKNFNIIFTKTNTKFCLSLHYNADNSYLFVNGKETIKFKADNKNVNFPNRFCLESIPDVFSATESREASLNGNVFAKKMFSLFIVLLNFSGTFTTKCLFLNYEPHMVRPTFIDLNPVELTYYPFMISLNKCSGNCNVLSPKICVLKESKDINVNASNIITNKNEAKTMTEHIS